MRSLITRLACAVSIGAATAFVAPAAQAHFVLEAPASWDVLDKNTGLPEKLGPCGNENDPVPTLDDAGRPIVTAFQEGGMITVTIDEVVFHPGHYRISLSTDWADAGDTVQEGFPDDPVVTPGETNSGTGECKNPIMSPCGSVPLVGKTPVEVPGVGWILADNVFEHCTEFTKPQTIQIPLPPGVTCTECAIQVLEFMSSHGLNNPGGCFYHHCANVTISGSAGAGGSGASTSSGSASGASGAVASGSSGTGGSAGSGGGGTGASSGNAGATSGSAAMAGSAAASGTVVATGGAGSSAGSMVATGTGTGVGTGSTTPSGSTGTGGTISPPAAAKSGCSISPRGASFGAGLAGLVLAAGLMRRRRR
jgi:hypothetical protein